MTVTTQRDKQSIITNMADPNLILLSSDGSLLIETAGRSEKVTLFSLAYKRSINAQTGIEHHEHLPTIGIVTGYDDWSQVFSLSFRCRTGGGGSKKELSAESMKEEAPRRTHQFL